MVLNIAQLFGDQVDEVEVPIQSDARDSEREIFREPALCSRCQHGEATLHIIHDGGSVRRDCGRCGRFIDFPIWYDIDAASNYIESQNRCS